MSTKKFNKMAKFKKSLIQDLIILAKMNKDKIKSLSGHNQNQSLIENVSLKEKKIS